MRAAAIMNRVVSILSWGLAFLLVALALISTAFRMMLFSLDDVRPLLAQEISQALHAEVEVGHAVSEWAGVQPYIVVEDLKIQFPESQKAHEFERVSFTLDLWRSLKAFAPVLEGVAIEGGAIEVQRLPDGSWTLEGLEWNDEGIGVDLPMSEIRARNIDLVLHDLVSQSRLHVGTMDIDASQGLLGIDVQAQHVAAGSDIGAVDLHVQVNPWGEVEANLILQKTELDKIAPWLPSEVQEMIGRLPAGTWISVEANTDWESRDSKSLAARVTLSQEQGASDEWQRLKLTFDWEHNAGQHRTAVEEIVVDDYAVVNAGYFESTDELLSAYIGTLDLGRSLALAQQIGLELEDYLPEMDLSGKAHDMHGVYDWSEQAWRSFQLRFEGLSAAGGQDELRVRNLDGVVMGTPQNLSASIESEAFDVSYPPLNINNFSPGSVRATAHVWRGGKCCRWQLQHLELEGPVAQLKGSASGDSEGRLSVDAQIERAHLPKFAQWLPPGLLLEADDRWVRKAFLKGDLRKGALQFRRSPEQAVRGTFDFSMSSFVDALDVDYEPGLPPMQGLTGRLVLNGTSLHLLGESAKVRDSRLSNISAYIEDLNLMYLHGSTHVSGPLMDMPGYLQDVEYFDERVANAMGFEGVGELQLCLGLSLDKRLKVPPVVNGHLEVDDVRILVHANDTSLDRVQGELRYAERRLKGALKGDFAGIPIDMGVDTNAMGEVELDMDVRASPLDFVAKESRGEFAWIKGTTDWEIGVTMPGPEQTSRRSQVLVHAKSGLQGVEIDLPKPLAWDGKAGTMPLEVKAEVKLGEGIWFDANYGQKARAFLETDGETTGGVILLGAGAIPEYSKTDLIVTGKLPEADFQNWYEWQERYAAGTMGRLSKISDLEVERLQLYGFDVAQARVSADFKVAGGQYTLDASAVKGQITVPEQEGQPVVGSFDRLILTQDEVGTLHEAQDDEIDPGKIPPLDMSFKTLKWGAYPFEEVHLITRPEGSRLLIEKLSMGSYKSHIDLTGRWAIEEQGPQTSLQGTVHSDDIHETLDHWEIDNPLRNGISDVNFSMHWPGGLPDYDFKRVEGSAKLKARDGQIRQVAPELARILALLNMEMIFDRLRLDFDDVLRAGFTYETAEGDFTMRDGSLYTEGLRIVGSSAQFLIAGRIGATEEDFDLRVVATPEVSVLLPVAAGAAAGPIGIAAAYLGNKLLELFGAGIDDASVVTYKVTGPWSDPVIEEVPIVEGQSD